MKVLMISNDKRILDVSSESARRMAEYEKVVGKISIVVFVSWIEKFLSVFFLPKRIKDICRTNKFDIITTQDSFLTALAGYRVKKRYNIALQIQVHTDLLSPFYKKESVLNYIRYMMACWLIPKADCLRTVSKRVKNSLIDKFKDLSPEKITILPIFVDAESVRRHVLKTDLHQKYPGYDFIVSMASRLTREKNNELAVYAMEEVVKEFPKTLLLIVGDGPSKNKIQVMGHRSSADIKLEDWTDNLFSYYKTADLFLNTSNYEGYGRTLVEAVISGCQVVSSDVGVAREILSEKNIFEIGNKSDLVKKISAGIQKKLDPPSSVDLGTKAEYLDAYKNSLSICL